MNNIILKDKTKINLYTYYITYNNSKIVAQK